MTLSKVYVRYQEDLPIDVSCFAACIGFRKRGVVVAPYYGFGDIEDERATPDLGHDVGIAGYIGDVWAALDRLGIERPPSLDYPEALRGFLGGRDLRVTTLGEIREHFYADGVFIKPVQQKLFTGFVYVGHHNDRLRIAPYPDDTKVWCSEVIEDLVSEFRCFVLRGELLGVRHYKGDWARTFSESAVHRAIAAWQDAPVAYTLDFGMSDILGLVLIEVNDGFAMGGYGLPPTLYAQMIEARWQQLVPQQG